MPIAIIPQDNSRQLQQLASIDLISRSLGTLGQAFEARRQLAERKAEKDALVAALSGGVDPGAAMPSPDAGPIELPGARLTASGDLGPAMIPASAPTPTPAAAGFGGLSREQLAALPAAALGQMFAQRYPGPGEGFTLNPGDVRYDAAGRPIATALAAPPEQPNAVREAQALGYDLGTPEGAAGYAQWRQSLTRPPTTTVNLPAAETRMQQIDADRVAKEIPTELRALRAEHGQITAMQGLLDQGVQTGNWEAIKQRARDMGINLPAGQGVEAFQALAKQQLLSKIQQLPGTASDSDIRVVEQAAGSAGRSAQGNRDVLEVSTAIQDRQAQLLLLEERYYQEHKSLRGFEQFAIDWAKANPLQLPQIASPGGQPSAVDRAAGAVEQGLSGAEASFEDLVNHYAR